MGRQFLLFMALSLVALGQNPPAQPAPAGQAPVNTQLPPSFRLEYVLGPNDQISIIVPQAEEFSRQQFKLDAEGFISLPAPLSGRLHAAGMTAPTLEAELTTRLRDLIREPQVNVTLVVYRTESVLFTGAFRVPGPYLLLGRKTLLEMLTTAGGLQPNASRRIRVTRRADKGPIPLPNAVENPADQSSSVEINLDSLTTNLNPAENLVLLASDVVNVERAERIFANGEVLRVGAIEMAERNSIPITQALSEAGGFTPNAKRSKVHVLRPILTTNRLARFEINLTRIYEGKDVDFPLLPNDELLVDRASTKSVLLPVGLAMLGSIPYIIISVALRP